VKNVLEGAKRKLATLALDTFSNSGIRPTDPAKDAGNFCMSVLKAWKNTCIKI
jgi:hypothetical protein